MLPRNCFFSELCLNKLYPDHLSLGKIVFQVDWCKKCVNTINLMSLCRKTQILAYLANFHTNGDDGFGACTHFKTINCR